MALAQSNERGQVCYQELVDLVSAIVCGQQGRARDLAKHSTLAKAGWAVYWAGLMDLGSVE